MKSFVAASLQFIAGCTVYRRLNAQRARSSSLGLPVKLRIEAGDRPCNERLLFRQLYCSSNQYYCSVLHGLLQMPEGAFV